MGFYVAGDADVDREIVRLPDRDQRNTSWATNQNCFRKIMNIEFLVLEQPVIFVERRNLYILKHVRPFTKTVHFYAALGRKQLLPEVFFQKIPQKLTKLPNLGAGHGQRGECQKWLKSVNVNQISEHTVAMEKKWSSQNIQKNLRQIQLDDQDGRTPKKCNPKYIGFYVVYKNGCSLCKQRKEVNETANKSSEY